MKTSEEILKEARQNRKKLANELKRGMTTIDDLKEVVEDLFSYSDAQVLLWGDEIIITTGYGVVEETITDSEDMRKKGDLKILSVRPSLSADNNQKD